jgi:hypothetical protein
VLPHSIVLLLPGRVGAYDDDGEERSASTVPKLSRPNV